MSCQPSRCLSILRSSSVEQHSSDCWEFWLWTIFSILLLRLLLFVDILSDIIISIKLIILSWEKRIFINLPFFLRPGHPMSVSQQPQFAQKDVSLKISFNFKTKLGFNSIIHIYQTKMEIAILGGGCFWCIEALVQRLKGVKEVVPGYCGGEVENPKYQQVKSGSTGHIEVIKVTFDPSVLTYEKLLEIFMDIHDPTQEDGQGEEDIGSQYLSAIFLLTNEQKEVAKKVVQKLAMEKALEGKKVFTQLREWMPFYPAEEYHQNYFNERGSSNSYCNIIPGKIAKMKSHFKEFTVA